MLHLAKLRRKHFLDDTTVVVSASYDHLQSCWLQVQLGLG